MALPDGVSSSANRPSTSQGTGFNPVGDQEFRDTHAKSDADSGPTALHHTLGRGAFQALPGSLLETIAPVGEVKMWFANTPPKGFVVLNGQELSRTEYRELWNFANDNGLVGTQLGATAKPFGSGDGSSTFTVPDFVYRVPMGVGNTAGGNEGMLGSFNAKYARFRAFALRHRHTISEVVFEIADSLTGLAGDHNHGGSTGSSGSHSHSVSTGGPSNTVNVADGSDKTPGAGAHTHTGSTSSDGSHSHTISSSGDHQHAISLNHTHEETVTQYSEIYEYFPRTGNDPDPSIIQLGVAQNPAFPYLQVIWVMRYTNRLDFEGAVQPTDPSI